MLKDGHMCVLEVLNFEESGVFGLHFNLKQVFKFTA